MLGRRRNRRRNLCFPVEARRGDRRVRQPIERDVVEDIVPGQPLRLSVEDAGDHTVTADVVIQNPGRKAGRQIHNSLKRLWPVRHLMRVAKAVLVEVIELVTGMLFIG